MAGRSPPLPLWAWRQGLSIAAGTVPPSPRGHEQPQLFSNQQEKALTQTQPRPPPAPHCPPCPAFAPQPPAAPSMRCSLHAVRGQAGTPRWGPEPPGGCRTPGQTAHGRSVRRSPHTGAARRGHGGGRGQVGLCQPHPREAPRGGSGGSRGGRRGAAAHPSPGPGYRRCQTAGCYELCSGSVSVAMAADLFYFSQLPSLRAPSKKHPPRAPASSPALRAPHGGTAPPCCPWGHKHSTSVLPGQGRGSGDEAGCMGTAPGDAGGSTRVPERGMGVPGDGCGNALGLAALPRSCTGLGQGGPSLSQSRHEGG